VPPAAAPNRRASVLRRDGVTAPPDTCLVDRTGQRAQPPGAKGHRAARRLLSSLPMRLSGLRPRAVVLAALIALVTTACGASDPAEPGPDAGASDAAVAIDATTADAPVAPQPIVAPPDTWTFIPIEGARCAQGGATGIIVRLRPGSRDLLLYFEGGGSCSDAETCWLDPTAANVTGYGAAEAAAESKLRSYSLFQPDAASGNPFATMNMVMIPYCTGDAHAGDAVVEMMVGSVARPTYFVGAKNAALALARLGATFPDLDRVFLAGTSAGGGGATFQYRAVRDTFATTVHSVIDSTPGFPNPADADKWTLWGVTPPCPTCTTVPAVRAYNRSLDPDVALRLPVVRLRSRPPPTGAASRSSPHSWTSCAPPWPPTPTPAATSPTTSTTTAATVSCHVITTKNRA
jgi:hypothetical protein